MTHFHRGQEVEVRAKTYMSIEANQFIKGTVEYGGGIMSLVMFDDGSFDVFRNEDIRPFRHAAVRGIAEAPGSKAPGC